MADIKDLYIYETFRFRQPNGDTGVSSEMILIDGIVYRFSDLGELIPTSRPYIDKVKNVIAKIVQKKKTKLPKVTEKLRGGE